LAFFQIISGKVKIFDLAVPGGFKYSHFAKAQTEQNSRINITVNREFQVPDASAEASNEEDMKQLRSAMRQIKSLDRAVIFLYLEEKSYQEIADIIGITTKNVGVKDCENQSQVVTNNEVKSWKIMVLSVFQKPGKGQRRLIAQKNCIQ
jgi:hypothetical protein